MIKAFKTALLVRLPVLTHQVKVMGEVTLDTGDKVEVTQSVLDCMELGYAITLHKAQGSQFPRVIVALQAGRIVDRAWLYTAITRAEAEIHLVGTEDDFKKIIETMSNSHKRNSYLSELLHQISKAANITQIYHHEQSRLTTRCTFM